MTCSFAHLYQGASHRIAKRLGNLKRRLYPPVFRLPHIDIDEIAPPQGAPIDPIKEFGNLPPRPDINVLHDDVTPLIRIVQAQDPEYVLEFGTGRGNATANICAFSDAHVYTVNALPRNMSGEITTFALTEEEIGKAYRSCGFQERVTQILEDTLALDVSRYVELACVNLAVIDACHDTKYVLNDFYKVLPTLQDDAVVLFHDTHPSRRRHLKGSYDACVILRSRGYDVKHINGTWWGYWRKGQYAEWWNRPLHAFRNG